MKTMPVNEVGVTCLIDNLDRDWFIFFQPQHRTRNGAVVARGLDDFAWRKLYADRSDSNGVVEMCRSCFGSSGSSHGGNQSGGTHAEQYAPARNGYADQRFVAESFSRH
jgi:hypothetical protein